MEPNINATLVLDEPRCIYYSGQVLTGHIKCELTSPLSYSVINLNFTGEAKVFWTESDTEEYNGVRRYVTVKYSGQETYFNTMLCVSGGMGGVITLVTGKHELPFRFQIPHAAPSSFRGEKGSVSYKVTAYIEFPDPTKNRYQLEKAFEVVAALDLNRMGSAVKEPLNLEFEETYSCCCSSDPVTVRVHVPATGFCPGQAIPITVNANNESTFEIKKIFFEIVQKECYHSIEPKSDYIPPEKILAGMKFGPILSRTNREYTYELQVPDFIAPNLENCKIIDVGYFIRIRIKLSGCKDDLEDENEICLGLVPLSSLVQNFRHPMQSDLPQASIPDPLFIFASNQNAQFQKSAIQNSAAYPTASYPGGPTPYPPSSEEPTPYPPSSEAPTPYPILKGPTPYPLSSEGPTPYPVSTGPTPYPPSSEGPTPYPVSTGPTPYPPSSEGPTPYPVSTGPTPYPPSSEGPTPYPVSTGPTPYPPSSEGPTPYPVSTGPTPYPPSSEGPTPYPISKGPTPYPPFSEGPTPYPLSEAPTSYAPAVGSFPNTTPNKPIPMSTLRTGNIGFVAPPSGGNAPYPTGPTNPPYPVVNSAPYPSDDAPTFGANTAPFSTNNAPYPTGPEHNSFGNHSAKSPPYPNNAPYPTGSGPLGHPFPYPPDNKFPYPENKSQLNKPPYPKYEPSAPPPSS